MAEKKQAEESLLELSREERLEANDILASLNQMEEGVKILGHAITLIRRRDFLLRQVDALERRHQDLRAEVSREQERAELAKQERLSFQNV